MGTGILSADAYKLIINSHDIPTAKLKHFLHTVVKIEEDGELVAFSPPANRKVFNLYYGAWEYVYRLNNK